MHNTVPETIESEAILGHPPQVLIFPDTEVLEAVFLKVWPPWPSASDSPRALGPDLQYQRLSEGRRQKPEFNRRPSWFWCTLKLENCVSKIAVIFRPPQNTIINIIPSPVSFGEGKLFLYLLSSIIGGLWLKNDKDSLTREKTKFIGEGL